VIKEEPSDIPVINPVDDSMVAVPGESLDQVPPPVVLLHVVVPPMHIGVVPVIV